MGRWCCRDWSAGRDLPGARRAPAGTDLWSGGTDLRPAGVLVQLRQVSAVATRGSTVLASEKQLGQKREASSGIKTDRPGPWGPGRPAEPGRSVVPREARATSEL